jgi:hypothetical protein
MPEALFRNAEESDYVVSWHDFNQTCGRFGTGFIEIGKMFPVCESLAASAPSQIIFPVKSEHKSDSLVTLRPQTRGRKYPALWQCFAAVAAMNSVYTSVQSMRCGPPRTLTIEQCVFPNRVLRDLYFHGFGKHGLFEHQILIDRIAFSEYVERVRWWLSRNDLPITMASGKAFSGKMCNLHFSKTGICFALDFPRCVQGRQFLNYLDSVVIELGAIPNIFKDSRLPPRVVAETYPDYEEFRKRLLEFDPKRRYSSELSTRLDL